MSQDVTFGSAVKERRHWLGLTQAELGRRVGCAAITIRKIEANALRPSMQIAGRLAEALGIPEAEQLAFVRLARTERKPSPLPTPEPIPEEIGQEDLSGRAIRGFEMAERIGAGGYGVVYRATQATVGREVAVKIILPQYANRPEFVRRFESEAQLVARLEHPHIVPLYDYWREPGVAYLIMRLLRGGNLEWRLKTGPLTNEHTLLLMEQICAALHTAHRANVIHRDIKPANILLDDDGNAYLADFGIAKISNNASPADTTLEGTVLGSPAYISPEQILAEPVKPQADIYSMGVMLYEMLSGKKPFQGPTPVAFIQQHLNEALPLLPANGNGSSHPAATTPSALDIAGGLPEVIYTSEGNAYLHLPGVIVAENAAGEVRYLLSDGLGSIRQAVDETGAVVAYQEFDPYGNPVSGNGSEPYGYTGEWWQAEVGLLHLRARWYAPSDGVFLSKDTWEGYELRPRSMNGWSYVEGNPVNWVDPTGYQTECDENGYCPQIDRYLCGPSTPGGYDYRGKPCVVDPNNIQIGNAPVPSPTPFQPPLISPTSPEDITWLSYRDERDLTPWLFTELKTGIHNRDIRNIRVQMRIPTPNNIAGRSA